MTLVMEYAATLKQLLHRVRTFSIAHFGRCRSRHDYNVVWCRHGRQVSAIKFTKVSLYAIPSDRIADLARHREAHFAPWLFPCGNIANEIAINHFAAIGKYGRIFRFLPDSLRRSEGKSAATRQSRIVLYVVRCGSARSGVANYICMVPHYRIITFNYTVRLLRPLRRRLLITRRPPLVAIRARNPWVRFRLTLEG